MLELNKEIFSHWTPRYEMASCTVDQLLRVLYFRPDFNTGKIVYIVYKSISKKEAHEYVFENIDEAIACYNEKLV